MKKTIQILLIIILLTILLLIAIFVFNPANLRTKLISSAINSYLSGNIEGYNSLDNSSDSDANSGDTDKHPLLNESQEVMLENLGVDVSKLPTEITPTMQTCFVEKLGKDRATELVGGATPSALEFIKARECLGK